jgi:hypothetical protein
MIFNGGSQIGLLQISQAEDHHSFSKNQEERERRTISWFKSYMKK